MPGKKNGGLDGSGTIWLEKTMGKNIIKHQLVTRI